jgi:hypothetical protein
MKKQWPLFIALIAVLCLGTISCSSDSSDSSDSTTSTATLGAQSGTIVSGTAGTATFAATTAKIADGTAGTIAWYTSSAGTTAGSAPTGITGSASALSGNAATVTITATTSAVAGSYYFKATFGTATSAVATLLIAPYPIGATGPAGGIIFYDKGSYSDGWRYLEAAPSDQSPGIQYGGYSTETGATARAIGTGKANTATIVTSLGAGSYAAQLCDDLTLGGYSDWFLPSKDELNQMYVNLKEAGRGDFTSAWYWSSSEENQYAAWDQYFDGGVQYAGFKNDGSLGVRAARAF